MRHAPFHGWYLVGVAFLVALFGWGLGFYGPGIYLVALQREHGWSIATISSAVTVYYIAGAVLIVFVGDAMERFGPRRIVLAGSTAMGLGVAALTVIDEPWQLYAAFLLMAPGWASMGMAAINTILAPWFVRRRGLAVSLALNGASCGGVLIAPLLVLLIGGLGFDAGVRVVVGLMAVTLLPIVAWLLHRDPQTIGALPDGDGPSDRAPATPPDPAPAWRRAGAFRDLNFQTISVPFALGLTAQVGFLTHQIAYLAPLIGIVEAGWCVSLTTAAAVAGRIGTGLVIDRVDRRLATAVNFMVQVAALGLLVAAPSKFALYVGCVGFGLGVGNLVTLPGLIVQREFAPQHFAQVISLIAAINQFTFAFGPSLLGTLRDRSGSYAAPLVLCMALMTAAAAIVLVRRPRSDPAVANRG